MAKPRFSYGKDWLTAMLRKNTSHFTDGIYTSVPQPFIGVKCGREHFTTLHKVGIYLILVDSHVKCCEKLEPTLHTPYLL